MEVIAMSKIIKRVMLKSNENGWVGNITGEMLIKEEKKETYISISDTGDTALYYVTDKSVFGNLNSLEPVDEFLEKYEFGEIDEYNGEKTMVSSKYYDCFKYLYGLLYKADVHLKVYKEDYGKDIDELGELESIADQNC